MLHCRARTDAWVFWEGGVGSTILSFNAQVASRYHSKIYSAHFSHFTMSNSRSSKDEDSIDEALERFQLSSSEEEEEEDEEDAARRMAANDDLHNGQWVCDGENGMLIGF